METVLDAPIQARRTDEASHILRQVNEMKHLVCHPVFNSGTGRKPLLKVDIRYGFCYGILVANVICTANEEKSDERSEEAQ